MNDEYTPTRRRALRTGVSLAAAGLGLTLSGSAAADPAFGRVWANGVLWRTKVASVLDNRPDPEDKFYFLHDGSKPITKTVSAQGSPAVSESAPGDEDWNGGQWTTLSAEVTDVEMFEADAPLTNEADILEKSYIDVTLGRPGFGPPNYFVCPLNGQA